MKESKISTAAIAYVKKKKKVLIQKFASFEKFPPAKNPLSIFMAGSPGAGKTEFSKELIKILSETEILTGIVRIDADEIKEEIPMYNGKNSNLMQPAASIGVEKIHDHTLKHGQNMLLDGTFANYEKERSNIQRSLDKKRPIVIFYLYQDPFIAWDFTKKREKLEGRFIPKEAFVESFFKAKQNANFAKKEFGKNIMLHLVIKNFSNGIEKIEFNINNIDNYLKMKYNNNSLIKILC